MNGLNYDCVYSHNIPKENLTFRKNEILRYMGQKKYDNPQICEAMEKLIPEVQNSLTPCGVFAIKKICTSNSGEIVFDNFKIKSDALSKNLSGCKEAVLFALTVGSGADRLIAKHSYISAFESLTVSSIATEAIESYADLWNEEIKEMAKNNGMYVRPRFSPGYGDFSLEFQDKLISLLSATQRCGICITDKLILTPSKTVTGIVGISETSKEHVDTGCIECTKTDCKYRKA